MGLKNVFWPTVLATERNDFQNYTEKSTNKIPKRLATYPGECLCPALH